jgi:hypothetical protein
LDLHARHQSDASVLLGLSDAQADSIRRTLKALMRSRLAGVESVKRKRSWQPAVRAVTIADYQMQYNDLELLLKAVEAYYGK